MSELNISRSHVVAETTTYALLEAGEGPLLLFGHGLFGGKELYVPLIEHFADRFHCVAIDWPGHGGSDFQPDGWGVDDLVDAVPLLVEGLGHETGILVGSSMGGAVFMRVAIMYPALVDGLINIGAGVAPPPPEALEGLQGFASLMKNEPDDVVRRREAETLVNRIFHAPDFAERKPATAALELDVMLDHPREGIALTVGVLASYSPIQDELVKIECPTLVIWGGRDARPELGAEIAGLIPDSRLEQVDSGGHLVALDAPNETAAAIEGFLRR